MTARSRPLCVNFMRRQAVAFELGITRHTLARIIKTDLRFPLFFEISPGIEVIERRDLDAWVRLKKKLARQAGIDAAQPTSTGLDIAAHQRPPGP